MKRGCPDPLAGGPPQATTCPTSAPTQGLDLVSTLPSKEG